MELQEGIMYDLYCQDWSGLQVRLLYGDESEMGRLNNWWNCWKIICIHGFFSLL